MYFSKPSIVTSSFSMCVNKKWVQTYFGHHSFDVGVISGCYGMLGWTLGNVEISDVIDILGIQCHLPLLCFFLNLCC